MRFANKTEQHTQLGAMNARCSRTGGPRARSGSCRAGLHTWVKLKEGRNKFLLMNKTAMAWRRKATAQGGRIILFWHLIQISRSWSQRYDPQHNWQSFASVEGEWIRCEIETSPAIHTVLIHSCDVQSRWPIRCLRSYRCCEGCKFRNVVFLVLTNSGEVGADSLLRCTLIPQEQNRSSIDTEVQYSQVGIIKPILHCLKSTTSSRHEASPLHETSNISNKKNPGTPRIISYGTVNCNCVVVPTTQATLFTQDRDTLFGFTDESDSGSSRENRD
jgi:hypothetical protein